MALYFGDQSVSLKPGNNGGSLLELSSVKYFGAVGNGTIDDTNAFSLALSKKNSVYVPEGTYLLSSELIIGSGCQLELAVGAVLKFTQTSGNCISMRHSAIIRGHHGTITVPYEFNGNVINIISSIDSVANDVNPWTKWDPQWKTARYITDLNITKADSRGFHYSVDGTCYGTAIYCECNLSNGVNTFMWGINFSGIRIAGGFNYGIYLKNLDSAWNHDGRSEAVMDACKMGVCLDNCNNQFVSAIIQPRRAMDTSGNYRVYAEYGILLKNSRNTDLTGSRVWDWGTENTKWTNGGQYQHIGMIGNCSGTILNDFLYYEDTSHDIRSLIYTDTVSNLEKLTILQEPITRWFKPVDNAPMFFDGTNTKELLLKEDYNKTFDTELTAVFTDYLSKAIQNDGAIFNVIGYKLNTLMSKSTGTIASDQSWSGAVATGFIPAKTGDTIYTHDFGWWDTTTAFKDNTGVILFNSNFEKITNVNRTNLVNNAYSSAINYFTYDGNVDSHFQIISPNVAYIRLDTTMKTLGTKPAVSINEEPIYQQVGVLSDTIKTKASNIIGLEELVRQIIASS